MDKYWILLCFILLLTIDNIKTQKYDYYTAAVVDNAPESVKNDDTKASSSNIRVSYNLEKYEIFVRKAKILENDYYTAAVVDYAPESDEYDVTKTALPNVTLLHNLKAYEKFVQKAKILDADIIVFPEYGLTTTHMSFRPTDVLPYATLLPNATNNILPNPCKNSSILVSTVIYRLSCAAKNNQIYVVINIPEKEWVNEMNKFIIYNTDVVFNREGAIVAKYRKYNLFEEPAFSRTPKVEKVTFKTDFGVTFGIFTCFDILFDAPAQKLVYEENVTDFIFPTAWLSQLPFLTAIQTQAGWSRTHGVNLLASNYRNPGRDFGGSGIYSAKKGILKSDIPVDIHSKMSVARVPKIGQRFTNVNTPDEKPQDLVQNDLINSKLVVPILHTKIENMTNFSHKSLSNFNETTVTSGTFSCKFSVEHQNLEKSDYKYKMVAYQGKCFMGSTEVSIQACGIVACLNENITSCGAINYTATKYPKLPIFHQIKIEGNFDSHNDSLVFPSTVTYDLYPLPYNNYTYTRKDGITSLSLKYTAIDLFTFGIYAHTRSII